MSMPIYRTAMENIAESDFTKVFAAGTRMLSVRFRWDEDSGEQYDLIVRGIQSRRDADPLLRGSDIIRDYDYLHYYLNLPSDAQKLEELLREGMEYPQSLIRLDYRMRAGVMVDRKHEAEEIARVLEPYENLRCWHLEVTDEEGNLVTADLRPGAWIHNQSASWALRFVTPLSSVGKNDLGLCSVEMAIGE